MTKYRYSNKQGKFIILHIQGINTHRNCIQYDMIHADKDMKLLKKNSITQNCYKVDALKSNCNIHIQEYHQHLLIKNFPNSTLMNNY